MGLRRFVENDVRNPHRLSLVKKGLKNPRHVLPYVVGRLFPNASFGPNWQRKNGVITWTDDWVWTSESVPDISATDYHLYRTFRDLFDDRAVSTALEVGCGYGRILPWIAEATGAEVRGIDANPDAISTARNHYPEFAFETENAADLSAPDDSFDLVVTRTVLQHVPPGEIESVMAEIERVLASGGWVLSMENTLGDEGGPSTWSRSVDEYGEMLPGCELVEVRDYDYPHLSRPEKELFLFRATSGA